MEILNTLFKYWVHYRQLTFIAEMFEPLVKSCVKFIRYLWIFNISVYA